MPVKCDIDIFFVSIGFLFLLFVILQNRRKEPPSTPTLVGCLEAFIAGFSIGPGFILLFSIYNPELIHCLPGDDARIYYVVAGIAIIYLATNLLCSLTKNTNTSPSKPR